MRARRGGVTFPVTPRGPRTSTLGRGPRGTILRASGKVDDSMIVKRLKFLNGRTGETSMRPVWFMTEEEFLSLRNDYGGFCLACEAEAFGIEPDARRYECEACGESRVYGAEEMMVMGRIEIVTEEDIRKAEAARKAEREGEEAGA